MNFLQWWSAGSTTTNGGLVVLVLLMLSVSLFAYFGGHRDGRREQRRKDVDWYAGITYRIKNPRRRRL
ncbi:MAG: hypothetical protein KH354_06220 [Clostridiales bacterium]|nr:hypothetical protein [Clostridiales bacterium]